MKKIMRIEDYVKENREVINDLRIASALLEKRRPIIAESLMDLAERLDDLAESEDERIRKYLIEELKAAKSVGELKFVIPQPTIEECIAYLEKQKEQKPEVKDPFDDEQFRRGYEAGKHDQKPAEWSEADEEKLKAICTYLRDYSRLVKLGDKLRFNEYCDFLESLRPQGSKDSLQTHWKPSEEQPEVFDTIAFQKGVKEGERLATETIQSRIDEILGDAQPNPILRMELQELINRINQ